MTTAPAPRRGLFLCKLFETFAVFFARIFSKFRVFLYPTFPPFRGLFLCDFFCSFGLFWWHYAAVSPAFFCAAFRFVSKAPGEIATGRRSRQWRGPGGILFCVRFRRVLSARQRPENRADTGRSGSRRPASNFQFFPVPLLCHFCAATAAHSYPQQHTRSNEKPRYQAVFG